MRALLLTALVVTACADDTISGSALGDPLVAVPGTYSFDESFPENLKDDVRWGAKRLELAAGCKLLTETDSGNIIFKYDPIPYQGQSYSSVTGAAHRLYDDLSQNIGGGVRFFPRWRSSSPSMRRNVATHEIAHVLGLVHGTEPTCLMYPQIMPDQSTHDWSRSQKPICKDERELVRKVARCGERNP
jgi:hypothetical protein